MCICITVTSTALTWHWSYRWTPDWVWSPSQRSHFHAFWHCDSLLWAGGSSEECDSAGQVVLMHTRILGLSIPAVVLVTKMGHFLGTEGLDLTSSPFGDCCTMATCNIRLHRGVIILHSWISLLHTFMKSCQTLATQNSFDLKQTSAPNSEQLCVGWKQRENNQFCNSNRCFVCWKQCVIYPHTYVLSARLWS